MIGNSYDNSRQLGGNARKRDEERQRKGYQDTRINT